MELAPWFEVEMSEEVAGQRGNPIEPETPVRRLCQEKQLLEVRGHRWYIKEGGRLIVGRDCVRRRLWIGL